jgi:hypothetical protein
MPEPWSEYQWVDRDPHFDAHCVSIVTGSAADDVVRGFAAHRASARRVTFAEQRGMGAPSPQGWGNDTVQIDVLDGAVICVEANGWAGIDKNRARMLSAGGLHVATYRSVNADMQVTYARAGALVRSFRHRLRH